MDSIKNKADFICWLDEQLNADIPDEIIAFNLNIYESPFTIEISGSTEFSVDNDDWACNEDWMPCNPVIAVSHEIYGESWEHALKNLMMMCEEYIHSKSANVIKLKQANAFALGFVDGDLTVLNLD